MFEKKNIKIIAGILVYAVIMIGIFTPFSIFEKGEAQKDEIDMAIELIRSAIVSALDSTNGWLPINDTLSIDLGIWGILDLIYEYLPIILIFIDMILLAIQILAGVITPMAIPLGIFRFLILKPIIIYAIYKIGVDIHWGI